MDQELLHCSLKEQRTGLLSAKSFYVNNMNYIVSQKKQTIQSFESQFTLPGTATI